MKIIITGINGFIGQHLAKKLLEKNHTVIGIGKEDKSKISGIYYYKGNILDNFFLKNTIEDCDAIIHLAALTSHKDISENKSETQEINLAGTKNVLEVFSKSKTKKFIYPSTGKVYGKIHYLPIDEKHPTEPLNILGKSKLQVEKLIGSYKNENKQFIIFRIFNVYGKGQDENFLIPTIFKQLSEGKKEITLGDVKAKRDYIYIDDLVDAFILAIEQRVKNGIFIYNICTQVSSSAAQIINLINKIKKIKIKIKVNHNLIRKDESSDEYGSFKLARKELNWYPKINLEEGLRKIFN